MELYLFYALVGLVLGSALFILFTKNVMYAAFILLLTFSGIAGIYIFLLADVVAVTQVMVYVGGILILLIFGVMFTNKLSGGKILSSHQYQWAGGLLGIAIFSLLIALIFQTNFETLDWIKNNQQEASMQISKKSSIEDIGVQLMTHQVFALEVVGLLLLLALIGTAMIAGKKL
ncbi:MAG: NADH-quinone oxidoreductase subunit J [Thermoflexibacter sp.]|jgi:NADH-quinone oxidoreductase subunit J|nr:NADH-quinone oxidoreductase subunit J [Thermoflexibacter sp.]